MSRTTAIAFFQLAVLLASLAPTAHAQGKFGFKQPIEGETKPAASGAGWKAYESEEGEFVILFPGVPIESDTAVKTAYGEATMKLASLPTGKSILGVSHMTLPSAAKRARPGQILVAARDEAVKGLGATVVSESDIESAGVPGKELTLDVPTIQASCRMRLFVVGDRVHQVTVTGSRESLESQGAQKFVDSWKIVK